MAQATKTRDVPAPALGLSPAAGPESAQTSTSVAACGLLKPPYPWFGGKARIAPTVWRAFGDVRNYVEPFAGGLACLLAAPWPAARTETVNDLNAWLCNFWRALQHDPEAVWHYADWPVSELDLHARGDWLFYREGVDRDFVERLRGDPNYYDAKSAGWWVWGHCASIGNNWSRKHGACCRDGEGRRQHKMSNLSHVDGRRHIGRSRPDLCSAGIHRILAPAGSPPFFERLADRICHGTGRGVSLRAYLMAMADRVRGVRVCCGDWSRVLGPGPTTHKGLTGVLLDPPYGVADRAALYGAEESRTVAHYVRAWCLAHANDPRLRIVLCGYAGEHDELERHGWRVVAWKTQGGYGNRTERGRANAARERLWLSPHCLPIEDNALPAARPKCARTNLQIGRPDEPCQTNRIARRRKNRGRSDRKPRS